MRIQLELAKMVTDSEFMKKRYIKQHFLQDSLLKIGIVIYGPKLAVSKQIFTATTDTRSAVDLQLYCA